MKLSLVILFLVFAGCASDASTIECEGEDCEETKLPPREGDGDRMRLHLDDAGDAGELQDDGSVDPDGGVGETDAQEPMDEPDASEPPDDAQAPEPDGGEPVQPDGGSETDAEVPTGAGACEICDETACAAGLLCMNLPGDSSHIRRCFPPCSNDDQQACADTFGAEFQCWGDGACSPVYENHSPYWFDQNCDLYLGN